MKEKTDFQKEMEGRLEQGLMDVYNSENWENYLKLYSNFSNFSVNNKILVMLQKPDAQIVKSFNSWQKDFERTVKKGEKAIYICRPVFSQKTYTVKEILEKLEGNPSSEFYRNLLEEAQENGGTATINNHRFVWYPEFDVSQTDGKELPPHTIRETLSESFEGDYGKVIDDLTSFVTENGYAVSVKFDSESNDSTLKNAYGYYRPSTKEIVVADNMSSTMTIKVLIHEIAHSMLHGKEMFEQGLDNTSFINKRDIKEIQAESVAYIVCQDLGIDSSKESFGYIAEFAYSGNTNKEDCLKKLRGNLEIIDKCANAVIEGLEQSLEKDKEDISLEDDYERD